MRVGEAWSPPVVGRVVLLPQEPDFAGAFSEQILTRETHGDGESFRSFADKHHVAGVLHHSFGNERNILDVADTAHRSGATRGSVHAAGVEFDHAFFIGKAAESDGIVVRVIFRALYNAQGRVERVTAAFQESEGVVEVIDAVVGADDDRPLRAARRFGRAGSTIFVSSVFNSLLNSLLRVQVWRIQTGGERCSDCGTYKSTTVNRHEISGEGNGEKDNTRTPEGRTSLAQRFSAGKVKAISEVPESLP